MAEQLKVWRNSQFNGGYSEDRHIGLAGSFWRGAGCEIRRFPRVLQLAKKMSNQAGAVVTTTPYCGIVTTAFGDTLIGAGSGKIYRRAKGASTWALVYTLASGDAIYSMLEYNGYVYFATKDKLHKIVVTDTGTDTTWTTVTVDHKTFATSTNGGHPMIEAFNVLYIGDGSKVSSLDSLGTWTAARLSFASDNEVRRITFPSGNMIRFWCRKGIYASSEIERDAGTCYFWNGTSDAYTESVPLAGEFHTCATSDGVDYFIAGQSPALYAMNGNVPVRLKDLMLVTNPSADDQTLQRVRFWPNSMCAVRGIIHFGSPTALSGSVSWMESGVWTWGRKNEQFPLSLNLDYPLTGDSPSLVMDAEGAITVGMTNGSTRYVYAEDWSKYQTTGEVETRVFDGGNPWQKKDAVTLAIGFYPLAAGEKIEVYVSPDFTGYGSAVLTADYADTADRAVTSKVLSLPFVGKEFSQTQIKVKLTAGTSQSTTPKLCDLSLVYEDIKRP